MYHLVGDVHSRGGCACLRAGGDMGNLCIFCCFAVNLKLLKKNTVEKERRGERRGGGDRKDSMKTSQNKTDILLLRVWWLKGGRSWGLLSGP